MSLLVENTIFALDALRTNRFRTFLSLLGIIIGVSAVIIIGGISRSGKNMIYKELETFGLKSIWVFRNYKRSMPGQTFKQGTGIHIDDIAYLRKKCETIQRISPIIRRNSLWAQKGQLYARATLVAAGTQYDTINNDNLTQGRFIVREDMVHCRPICIIGSEIIERLFKQKSPIGEDIQVGKYKYTVVGILQQKDRDFLSSIGSIGRHQNENARVIIPITVFQKQYHTREVDYIQAQVNDTVNAIEAGRQISDILARRYSHQYAYRYQTMQQYIETADNILRIVSWIGGMAAMISIIVGGIGIMNIMIASVLERTKEIGIRKAVGARSRDIMYQFIAESTLVTLCGGIVGMCMGILFLLGIGMILNKPADIAGAYIAIALAVSLIVGLVSGIYPAARAATMDPVDALKRD